MYPLMSLSHKLSLLMLKSLLLLFVLITFFAVSVSAQTLTLSTLKGSDNGRLAEKILVSAYQRIGLSIKTVELPAARALAMADQGLTDGELQRIFEIGNRYQNLLRIPTPLFTLDGMVFTIHHDFAVNGKESLRPYQIGIVQGIKYAESLTHNLRVTKVTKIPQLIRMLEQRRIDLFILSRFHGLGIIKEQQYMGIRMLEPPLVSINLYHYLHKKNRRLIPSVNASLEDMKQEGLIDKIVDDFLKDM